MYKAMKIKNLKNYGIPSYILNIWEKHYSPYLLPLQEDAVKKFGVLDYGEGSTRLPRHFASRNDKREDVRNGKDKNFLVIAPTSSGKTFIGEMAAIAQVIHLQKIIYLVPLRALADEKHRHFRDLYSRCGMDIVISTRDRNEDDHHIISGDYDIAVIAYEKFNYFCWRCPQFLEIVSLVIIDEMQLINDSKWGLLLESMVNHIAKKNENIKIVALSAFIEGQRALLRWFSARILISYQRPVELRRGIVREGVFEYITSKKKKNCRKEVFFNPEAVRENCFEDYLLETVRYLLKQGESTLIFFATCAETQKWAKWLASQLEGPAASCALEELKEMEETLSRDELRETLEKGIAYYNQDLSWEERNLIETYFKEEEIKVICTTNIMAMGINLNFKNVIIALDKIYSDEGNYPPNYRNSFTFAAIENMGGRAGILEFGRVIFLAHSLLFQTIYKNLYFKFLEDNHYDHKTNKQLINIDHDFLSYLLNLVVNVKLKQEELKSHFKNGEFIYLSGYWKFAFNRENIDKKIEDALNILKGNRLIKVNKNGVLSPTDSGILIAAKRIRVETFLFFKSWLRYCKNGDISILEILFLLALSPDGKALPIHFSQAIKNDYKKGMDQYDGYRKNYWNKLLRLIFEQNDEDKKLFRDKILMKKEKEEATSLEEYITFKKTHLLYDWIMGEKSVKEIEQEYGLYRGCIYRLGEGFSWLADSLAAIAESVGWEKKINKDLNKIRTLSNRLVEGVREEGLNLALLHIPGLSRYYIRSLLGAGYGDEECLKRASEEELGKIVPKKLAERIKKRTSSPAVLFLSSNNNQKTKKCNLQIAAHCSDLHTLNTNDQRPTTIMQIDKFLPGRIIFEEKEIEVTAKEFSLIYLLSQNRGKTITYSDLLDTLWTENEYSTYVQITSHLYKIRRAILKTIGNNKKNKERVKDILKVISRRGIMLNLEEDKLKIS
ncbi:MAG: DEAD/DEAH box helicase [Atribacterota bacterium]|nr:DEAD/DEAH box helicase [Atribacterota bacterium]